MDLETRVKRLERENLILKYGGLLVVAVVLFSAFFPPAQVQDVVRARRFELRDSNGRLAAVLELDSLGRQATPGAILKMFRRGNQSAVLLTGGLDGGSLLLSNGRQGFVAAPGGLELETYRGFSGEKAVQLRGIDGEIFLRLKGPNGEVVLGNETLLDPLTGAETTFPVSTLTLYDAEGNVRYQIPR